MVYSYSARSRYGRLRAFPVVDRDPDSPTAQSDFDDRAQAAADHNDDPDDD